MSRFSISLAVLLLIGGLFPTPSVGATNLALPDSTDDPVLVDNGDGDDKNDDAETESGPAQESAETSIDVNVSGAIRFNTTFRAYGEAADKVRGPEEE